MKKSTLDLPCSKQVDLAWLEALRGNWGWGIVCCGIPLLMYQPHTCRPRIGWIPTEECKDAITCPPNGTFCLLRSSSLPRSGPLPRTDMMRSTPLQEWLSCRIWDLGTTLDCIRFVPWRKSSNIYTSHVGAYSFLYESKQNTRPWKCKSSVNLRLWFMNS